MRLRQAHAILEAAAALKAISFDHCRYGFEFSPFDHDRTNVVYESDDYLTGYAEFNDPDHPNDHTRTYNIDIKPGPRDMEIEVLIVYSYDPNATPMLHEAFSVVGPSPEEFDTGLGVYLADRIASMVREHEKPYRAAYAARAT